MTKNESKRQPKEARSTPNIDILKETFTSKHSVFITSDTDLDKTAA